MASYRSDSRGLCPHCRTVVRFEKGTWHTFSTPKKVSLGDRVYATSLRNIEAAEDVFRFIVVSCPECRKAILVAEISKSIKHPSEFVVEEEFVVWPRQSARPPIPDEVPSHIAADYNEAASVLNLSPKASAALSRRCLQALLREVEGADQRSLSQQIDAVMPRLPGYIAESIDAVRNIGNFAAHPIKDQNSGQIVEIESGEAE